MAKKKVCPVQSRAEPMPLGRKVHPEPIITDPQGSYTGRPIEEWETPVQDADDL